MRTAFPAFAFVFVTLLRPGPALAQPVTAALDYGRHPVGFRAITEIDRSRTVQSKTTFDGKPLPGEAAMPLQIGIWYPAADATSGTPMSAERYKTTWSAVDRNDLVSDFRRMVRFGD